jgi:hypothetical protein
MQHSDGQSQDIPESLGPRQCPAVIISYRKLSPRTRSTIMSKYDPSPHAWLATRIFALQCVSLQFDSNFNLSYPIVLLSSHDMHILSLNPNKITNDLSIASIGRRQPQFRSARRDCSEGKNEAGETSEGPKRCRISCCLYSLSCSNPA